MPVISFIINLTEQKCHAGSLGEHSASFNSCLPVFLFRPSDAILHCHGNAPPTLKNSLFILSGDTEFALRSIVFSLPHAPLIIRLMDRSSHCAFYSLCVCGLVWGNCLCEDTFRAPWGNCLSLFYPLVACPTSCSPISFSTSPDSRRFNVTSQGCVPGWGAVLEWIQRDLGTLSVVFVWYCGLRLLKKKKNLQKKLTDIKFKGALPHRAAGFELQITIDFDMSTYLTETYH